MKRLLNYLTKLYFERQSKPKGFDDLEYKFIDSNGKRYYVWKEILDLPLSRKPHLDKAQMELSRMMTGDELTNFLDKQKELIEDAINEPSKRAKNLAAIMMQNEEIRMRNELLFHKEIFIDLIACITIREDELPERFDQEIHSEKVKQFMDDSESGLAFFLQKSGLSKLIPYIDELGEDLATLLEKELRKLEIMNGSRLSDRTSGDSVTNGTDTSSTSAEEMPAD